MQTIEKVKELAKGYDIVPVFRYGYDRFSKKCAEIGIDGFIIPDMPYEESAELTEIAAGYGVDKITMIAKCGTEAGDRKMNELAHKPQSFT
mgnify:FL=1